MFALYIWVLDNVKIIKTKDAVARYAFFIRFIPISCERKCRKSNEKVVSE